MSGISAQRLVILRSTLIEDKGEIDADFDVTGTFPSKTMTLYATAYKVTSDRTNDNKFYIYGNSNG